MTRRITRKATDCEKLIIVFDKTTLFARIFKFRKGRIYGLCNRVYRKYYTICLKLALPDTMIATEPLQSGYVITHLTPVCQGVGNYAPRGASDLT